MKKRKTPIVMLLITALVLSVFSGQGAAAQKKKKLKFNRTKMTLTVGNTGCIDLKNNTKSQNVKWSTSNKKVVSLWGKTRHYCFMTAKRTGTTRITAKIGKVTLKCKVTVKPKKQTIPVESGLDKLKKHLLTQGYTASDGSKGMSRNYNGIESFINYYPEQQLFVFNTFSAGDQITMEINENNPGVANLNYSDSWGAKGSATATVSITRKDSTFDWRITECEAALFATTKKGADIIFNIAYLDWEILLISNVGLHMSDLGFRDK
ncbi:MAG: hypothetical protein NC293_04975 [Roseburia sp.]|nr:hypothetical protein [Roseburia sp.]